MCSPYMYSWASGFVLLAMGYDAAIMPISIATWRVVYTIPTSLASLGMKPASYPPAMPEKRKTPYNPKSGSRGCAVHRSTWNRTWYVTFPTIDRETKNRKSVPGMTLGGGALPLALWRKQTQPIAVHTKLVRRGYKQPTMVAKFTMIRNEGKQSFQCHFFSRLCLDALPDSTASQGEFRGCHTFPRCNSRGGNHFPPSGAWLATALAVRFFSPIHKMKATKTMT